MAAQTNDAKLGFFVLLGTGLVVLSLTLLGAKGLDKTHFYFETYFDESVQGLEKGASVKFRGAPIGTVTEMGIAPDQKLVKVVFDVDAGRLLSLGFKPENAEAEAAFNAGGRIPGRGEKLDPNLRIQLVSAGITGQKYLEVGFFDHDPMPLQFPAPVNYFPGTPSTLKSLEESVMATLDQAPAIATQISETLTEVKRAVEQLNAKLEKVDIEGLSKTAEETLSDVRAVIKSGQTTLESIQAKKLPEKLETSLESFTSSTTELSATLVRIQEDDGALANLEAITKQLNEQLATIDLAATVANVDKTVAAAGGTADAVTKLVDGGEIERALRSIDDAAKALRLLVDALERDSDMLLKGREQRN